MYSKTQTSQANLHQQRWEHLQTQIDVNTDISIIHTSMLSMTQLAGKGKP